MSNPIRVVIVDDSAFARFIVTKALSADPSVEVVDWANNCMTMGFDMPLMDGLSAVAKAMEEEAPPVVILSAIRGTDTGSTTTSPTAPAGCPGVSGACRPGWRETPIGAGAGGDSRPMWPPRRSGLHPPGSLRG